MNKQKEISVHTQRKMETKKKVLSVALEIFKEKGYAQTTMDSIAERSGISRRTLFRLFPKKEDLLIQSGEEMISKLLRTTLEDAAPLPNLFNRVREILARASAEEREAYVAWLKAMHDESDVRSAMMVKLMDIIQLIINKAKQLPEIKDEQELWAVAGAFMGGVVAGWAQHEQELTIDPLNVIAQNLEIIYKKFVQV
ncbi:TetR/AcrR family transcriptional regulator [Sporolactobacillus shoreicorticis]|uniref:TetR/AcrR family transcriptional regulator n=1 Tax=Sporolactobacillus shoreicorticis TaxID=1923877 RepID=A0ABW5S484_9BACL|nr:TetR/AcrR family transcriptional regulator [Sporolactobacillus shoreicorticis]MCO7124514.1 TetR/AcrR family transcriptional regulator [Sporolactobacillus shoreicorticis]